MATATQTDPLTASVEAATERLAALNRTVGAAYVDSYERAALSVADAYEKAAATTRVDWLSTVGSAQADVAREVAKACAGAARDFVS
jgi:hypothetical protein